MRYNKLKVIIFLISLSFSKDIKVRPLFLYQYSSDGSDWVYKKNPITIFGVGLGAYYENNNWTIEAEYIQLGFLGKLDEGLYDFSPIQSFPYIDKSKDADGYWTEYANAKIVYSIKNINFEFGKFDRHWGPGKRALHISRKAPSYPQIGFKWKIADNLNLTYFHGFLNSGLLDSNRADIYDNNFSQRSINITRNIASHRIEWNLNSKIKLSANETVIYATRNLDIHYLIPVVPFYPIENYLGDTDNIQMGCDISIDIIEDHKLYMGFFMDELTPEWLFKNKNHNWFAWQFGYNAKNILFNGDLSVEFNWTDQRVYKHKYIVNDFYSHGQPLGFWAGPHAEEYILDYFIPIKENKFSISYSIAKRGAITEQMVEENYNDNQNERYASGYEERSIFKIKLVRPSRIEALQYEIAINQVKFINAGFNPSEPNMDDINLNKISSEFGISYNFDYPGY